MKLISQFTVPFVLVDSVGGVLGGEAVLGKGVGVRDESDAGSSSDMSSIKWSLDLEAT